MECLIEIGPKYKTLKVTQHGQGAIPVLELSALEIHVFKMLVLAYV